MTTSCEVSRREFQGLIQTNNGYSISLYSDAIAEPNRVVVEMARLRTAFPKQSDDFFNLLAERVVKNGFSGERLKDAVNSVIDGFSYKELNIADIIKFDRREKLLGYEDVCRIATTRNSAAVWDEYERIEIDGSGFWRKKQDK